MEQISIIISRIFKRFWLLFLFYNLSSGIYLWDRYYVPELTNASISIDDALNNRQYEFNFSYAINISFVFNEGCNNNTYYHLTIDYAVAIDYDSKVNFSNIFTRNNFEHFYWKFTNCPKYLIILTDKNYSTMKLDLYHDNYIFNEHYLICHYHCHKNPQVCNIFHDYCYKDPERYRVIIFFNKFLEFFGLDYSYNKYSEKLFIFFIILLILIILNFFYHFL